MNAKRALGVGQGALGLALVAFPGAIAARTAGNETPPPTWLVRVLGVRLIGQGGWLTAEPSDRTLRWTTMTDLVHGSSMLAAVVANRSHRRSAAVAAAMAALSIAVSVAIRR
jgi:hypothetical protein